ncbi:MAG TPA: Uma2 family endonuclease [Roseiflexaceae bacterium]|nr:Uma2 family endonuclease [Roseiflexaceae bacterium]
MTTSDVRLQSAIYPESDGEPVGETDIHRRLMFDLIFALTNWLNQTIAYVAGNLFIYYEEGNPAAVVAPDVFVIPGVPQADHRVYKSWENDRKLPAFVIELTSSKTRYEDLGNKRVLYAELGVQEYYVFDPLGDYLDPRLRGYQLIDGELLPLPGPRFFSRLLNLELRAVGDTLRFYEMGSDTALPTPAEEREARLAAEAEIERLRAEIERLRAGHQ